MFMRTGWVVGQAGLRNSLIILAIANAITLLTSLSLSAIATNTKVGGGGAYFLISRSLGLEIGGSIGTPLFLAQAISVSFYIIGFSESVLVFFPQLNGQILALAVLLVVFLITWTSSEFAVKAQSAIFIILGISLISFFLGFSPENFLPANIESNYSPELGFWAVFAIFFPAVTGVMSGASMSGDLENPSRNIPRGTLLAVIVTCAIYGAQMFWLAKNASPEDLKNDTMIMHHVSLFSPLIYLGLWAATLSSAIASLLAAPRTLQALANDGVFPKFLAKTSKTKGEPRIALLFTGLISASCIAIGELNLIAPIISMFFLATYGTVNLVAGIERWSANPSYRPTFKVHWILSILGALGCIFVMLLLNPLATIGAVLLMLGFHIYLATRQYQTAWGDTWSGFWFSIVRVGLIKFNKSREHIRNWRPVLLVLSGNPGTRQRMVEFADFFENRRGFIFLAQILTGDWDTMLKRRAGAQVSIDKFITKNKLTAESQVIVADNFKSGVSTIIQTTGVGPLFPNTVLLGWSADALNKEIYRSTLLRILELDKNLLIYVPAKKEEKQLRKTIDIWWAARVNGSLMLILAHLLQSNKEWKDYELRLLSIVPKLEAVPNVRSELNKTIEESRIEANAEVIISDGFPLDSIAKTSADSAVTFVGFNLKTLSEGEGAIAQQNEFLSKLNGTTFLTKNWQELQL